MHQNELMQLIQYDPSTDKVARRPILFVPPVVNKFYHFDLSPKTSFLKWLVDQGHTVFVISWINPDERHAEMGIAQYMTLGPLAAMDAIRDATGEASVNIVSFCMGGTLTAATLAFLAAKGEADRVASATMIATLLDFTDMGDFSVFVSEAHIAAMRKYLAKRGYVDSNDLTRLFSAVRANDQIWSPAVSHYLMGQEAAPSDLLYWFADGARIPERMHNDVSENFVHGNKLREKGGVSIGGCRARSRGGEDAGLPDLAQGRPRRRVARHLQGHALVRRRDEFPPRRLRPQCRHAQRTGGRQARLLAEREGGGDCRRLVRRRHETRRLLVARVGEVAEDPRRRTGEGAQGEERARACAGFVCEDAELTYLSFPAKVACIASDLREGNPGGKTGLALSTWVPFPSRRFRDARPGMTIVQGR